MKKLIKGKSGYEMSRLPLLLLRLFLPLICAALAYVAVHIVQKADGGNNMIDSDYVYEMIEHIFLGLTVLICGSLLLDLAIKKQDK